MRPRTFLGAGISNPAGIKKSTGAASLQYFTLKQDRTASARTGRRHYAICSRC